MNFTGNAAFHFRHLPQGQQRVTQRTFRTGFNTDSFLKNGNPICFPGQAGTAGMLYGSFCIPKVGKGLFDPPGAAFPDEFNRNGAIQNTESV